MEEETKKTPNRKQEKQDISESLAMAKTLTMSMIENYMDEHMEDYTSFENMAALSQNLS